MVFRHSRVTTCAIFVLAVVMVSPSAHRAQDPSMTPPPQDLPVEVLVPPPPAVEMAAPSLPTGPGALQALRDGAAWPWRSRLAPGCACRRVRAPCLTGAGRDRRRGRPRLGDVPGRVGDGPVPGSSWGCRPARSTRAVGSRAW